jgi:hypothetical protein
VNQDRERKGIDSREDAAAERWPPPSSVLSNESDLPGVAYVVARAGWRQVLPVMLLPVLVYLTLFRFARSGVVLSRLVNPGVLGLLVTTEVLLAGWCLARRGRATVVATSDWIAVRGLNGRRWRQQPFGEVARFSCRSRSGRGWATAVTVQARNGRRTCVNLGGEDPPVLALLNRLRSVGAAEVDSRQLVPMSRSRACAVVALTLSAAGLPVGYLALGPLRLLPAPIAGAFTWSGCRASLAVENQPAEPSAPYVIAALPSADGTWRLRSTREVDATAFVQDTEDPADRMLHLQEDGFLRADRAYLQNDAGAVVDVQLLRFATQDGARAYEGYVDRAVCEHGWHGRSGPRPTEVHLRRGPAAVDRWVGGESLVEVSQTSSTPFPTPEQLDAVAAALGAAAGSPPTSPQPAAGR